MRTPSQHTWDTHRANWPPAATHPPPILHAPLRVCACYAALHALMHSMPRPTPSRDRACVTSLQALMHGVPMPTPYSTPLIALYSAGVTRLKITSALAGAMRMSAKPPVSLPWRGLSPRGRDTPASRRAGHARACPEGRAVWSRHGHPTHEHLEFRFACTIARGSAPWHGAHEHMECSIAGTHAEWNCAGLAVGGGC